MSVYNSLLSTYGVTCYSTKSEVTAVLHRTQTLTAALHRTQNLTAVLHRTQTLTAVLHGTQTLTDALHRTQTLTAVLHRTQTLTDALHRSQAQLRDAPNKSAVTDLQRFTFCIKKKTKTFTHFPDIPNDIFQRYSSTMTYQQ